MTTSNDASARRRCRLTMDERLYLRDAVSRLYAEGQSFVAFPFRVVYRLLPPGEAQAARVAVMTVAPKRRFRHAVDRNRVKRLTREAYRLQKHDLVATLTAADRRMAVAFMCVADSLPTFDTACRAVAKALRRLQQACAAS